MSFLVAIVGLAFLIFIHEAGHFFTARLVRMRPRRFYVGFPPALVKTTRNGIEYGIGAIPLGGYVKIPGMHRPAPGDLDTHFGFAVREDPSLVHMVEPVKRHLAAGELEEARATLEPLRAAVGAAELSPAAARAARRGLEELDDGLGRDAYWRAATWKRVAVIFAGPGMNVLLAIVLFAGLYMVGGGKATTTVDAIVIGHPAAAAGLKPGDRIVAIDGRLVTEPSQIPERISGSKGRPLTLVVDRNGRAVTIGPVSAQKTQGAYRLGFVLRGKGLGFGAATWNSLKLTGEVTREIGKALVRIAHGGGRKDISSPVGIVQGSSDAVKEGGQTYLWVLGFLSLSLALLNLLPLLPLDGGHIAFSVVEGLRGRSVGREVYERVSAVGIALVLLLFIVGLSNDIGRLSGG